MFEWLSVVTTHWVSEEFLFCLCVSVSQAPWCKPPHQKQMSISTAISDSSSEITHFATTTWVESSVIWKGTCVSRIVPLWKETWIQSTLEPSISKSLFRTCYVSAKLLKFSGPAFPNLCNWIYYTRQWLYVRIVMQILKNTDSQSPLRDSGLEDRRLDWEFVF